jgi:hypothetical protein
MQMFASLKDRKHFSLTKKLGRKESNTKKNQLSIFFSPKLINDFIRDELCRRNPLQIVKIAKLKSEKIAARHRCISVKAASRPMRLDQKNKPVFENKIKHTFAVPK